MPSEKAQCKSLDDRHTACLRCGVMIESKAPLSESTSKSTRRDSDAAFPLPFALSDDEEEEEEEEVEDANSTDAVER